ncbi:hypothetical protein ASPWEDRAFT_532510 [Aspergillus wentii DTO 134E9]|uniref:Zn(2)-C6 fungal-type domain-containing protein n=1 Tax=Aspergillus wentii DTO 134E9 TaxID=1073089 RepID=A0A1L9RM64_ASPWE|nr:uncharacterized protein ASPWEDRAFT_532510 [Aspergillus wentii DTO 134E9]OJJ35927.1 hypothetical protein ASPWEDRAFT_532510 [Aspergillus wentii DTO 134E9]
MATNTRTAPRKLRRTANACVACRSCKIKCSGEPPCANCQRRLVKCRFIDPANKVTVAEEYLHNLQRQAREQQHPSSKRSVDIAFGPEIDVNGGSIPSSYLNVSEVPAPSPIDNARSIWTNPFTLPSKIIKNTHMIKRNWIWLAPSSMWSLTARLTVMMTERLHLEPVASDPGFLEGDIYDLQWMPSTDGPDVSGLPSIDHSLYLFNTVKFHLGQNYRFFDESAFTSHLHEFYYGNALEKATECRLWFVQFLLVLAFGNAFLSRSRNSQDPPGSRFFVRAMSLMPDLRFLWKDCLLSIEVLALAGLYLYSIDHRESAHVYVGQAIRIAQLEGLHTQLPEEELGPEVLMRCRNLWWTLYIMDRHFSSSLGLPMTTHDSDITTLVDPPSACSQQDATLSLQVRLSQLLSSILTTIYKTERTQLGTFLEQTSAILHTMAGHAQEIERIIRLKFQNSLDTMPRGTRHITLSYHLCVMLATRPLLLSVLKERLEKLDHGEEDWKSLLAPTRALIHTGIKSAVKTLQILSDENSLLVFLPFELEFTYGAAIYLTMTKTLFPHSVDGEACSKSAHSILDEMIHKGNRLAEVRSAELTHLEQLFQHLTTRIEQQDLQTLYLSTPEQRNAPGPNIHNVQEEPATDPEATTAPLATDLPMSPTAIVQEAGDLDFLESIGISSYEFLSIVDQIGNQEGFSTLDPS